MIGRRIVEGDKWCVVEVVEVGFGIGFTEQLRLHSKYHTNFLTIMYDALQIGLIDIVFAIDHFINNINVDRISEVDSFRMNTDGVFVFLIKITRIGYDIFADISPFLVA